MSGPMWAAVVVILLGAGLVAIPIRLRITIHVSAGAQNVAAHASAGPFRRCWSFPPRPGDRAARVAVPRFRPGRRLIMAAAAGGRRLAARTRVRNVQWRTEIGLSDAAATARMAGVAWALKSALMAAVQSTGVGGGRPHLGVIPRFSRCGLDSRLRCIVVIRGGDIISALAVTGWSLYKNAKEADGKWPRRQIPLRA